MSTPEIITQHAVAIIGSGDAIMGFSALGFKLYPAQSPADCRQVLTRVLAEGAAVCLIQEELYLAAQEEIAIQQSRPLPVILPFSADGRLDMLDQMVKAIRLKATGVYQR